MSENVWKNKVKVVLKAEIAKRNLNYVDISERLEKIGVHETPQNISNKIGCGTFGAIFMMQILEVIDCNELKI